MPVESALVLAPETPYPLAGGGALRTASLLHGLAQKYAVDLVVFREPGAPDPRAVLPHGLVRRVSVIDLPANGRDFAAKALRNAARLARGVPPLMDRFGGFHADLARAVSGEQYELGVIEHFWCAPYAEVMEKVCRRTVLDLHNVESVLHSRCAATEPAPMALAHRRFASSARRLEAAWYPRFTEILTPSDADGALVRGIAPEARVRTYPNAIPRTAQPAPSEEEAIVFSGNLEYHPNISAVRFFRREVWPRLRAQWPKLEWRLVGKNAHAVSELIAGDARIVATGPVADAIAELARAQVAVVPMRAGSGTRLKILEAWAAGVPVVSTALGAEGLPVCEGHHLLLAETGEEFAASVSRLLACRELRAALGRAGRRLFEEQFTWEIAWQKLLL